MNRQKKTQSDENIESCFVHAYKINMCLENLDKMCKESSFKSIMDFFQNIKYYLSVIQEIFDKYTGNNITALKDLNEKLNNKMDSTIVECLINTKYKYDDWKSFLQLKCSDIEDLYDSFKWQLKWAGLSEDDINKQMGRVFNYLKNIIDDLTFIDDNITKRLSTLVQDYQYGCLMWKDISKLASKYTKYQAEITKCRKILQQPLLIKLK